VAPSEVVAQRTIRNALGISCEPASVSSASTVEIHTVPASVAANQGVDTGSNEFLARGTSDEPIVI